MPNRSFFLAAAACLLFANPCLAQDGAGAPAPVDWKGMAATELAPLAEGGNAEAAREMARRCFAGEGMPVNKRKGMFYLRQAAEAGSTIAAYEMALALEEAEGEGGDLTEVVHWLKKSAANYAPASRKLADYTMAGLGGIVKSETESTRWMARAARAGDVLAMNELAVRYQQGVGVDQDPVSAIGWFSLAAQHGLAAAHVNLGNAYENGIGALVDANKAGTHYAAAAKASHPVGQALIARFFEKGIATEPNLVYAYVNYRRAGEKGVVEAAENATRLWEGFGEAEKKEAAKLLGSEEKAAPPKVPDPPKVPAPPR